MSVERGSARRVRAWTCTRSILVFLVLPASLSVVVPPNTFAQAPPKFYKESLNIVIPGMNAQANNAWFGRAAILSPTHERYVILYDDGTPPSNSPFRLFEQNRFDPKKMVDDPKEAPLVDGTRIIRIRDANSAESRALIQEIAQKPNATVVVDMNIPLCVKQTVWGPQTEWAGSVAAQLAMAHKERHPQSHTLLLGHSAGTEAMAVAQRIERDIEKKRGIPPNSLEVLPSSRRGALFDLNIAQSPRSPDRLAVNTVMVVADGDFYYSPQGQITPGSVAWTMGQREAASLAERGYRVVRAVNENKPGPNWAAFAVDMASWARTGARIGQQIADRVPAHSNVVVNVSYPDQRFNVYPIGGGQPVEMPSTSMGNILRQYIAVVHRQPGASGATAQPAAISATQQLKELADSARQNAPTPGLGGISLTAVARLPIDANEVEEAGYQAGRLYLRLRGGKTILLPDLDHEVVQMSYQVAYRDGAKPELSIGSPPHGEPPRQEKPGWHPVYFLGDTENTPLGDVMLRADESLAQLTYGSTAQVRSVTEKAPNYHSLAELFPRKYTDHADSHRFLGADERVYLYSSLVEMDWTDKRDELRFAQTSFDVRFGQSGPAEEAFAALFSTHFNEMAGTEIGAPLKALVPYAKAVAWFRWLKTNRVPFVPGALTGARLRRVFTPSYVAYVPLPKFEEIAPRAPTISFGPSGPERIIRADGRETALTYKDGRPVQVSRYDGAILEVKRDALSKAVGLRISGDHEAAFFVDEKRGPVFAENIRLVEVGGKLTPKVQGDTIFYPDNQPDATLALILSRFVFAETTPGDSGFRFWVIALCCVIFVGILVGAMKLRRSAPAK